MSARAVHALWVARMPLLVGVIVAACLTSVGTLIARAGSTASIGIEPDYYRKGLEWDRLQGERRRSEALGWTASIDVDADGSRVVVRLTDREGNPVDGVKIAGEVFAHRASAHRVPVTFSKVDGITGMFVAEITKDNALSPGKWRVSLTATRREDRFIIERDVEAVAR